MWINIFDENSHHKSLSICIRGKLFSIVNTCIALTRSGPTLINRILFGGRNEMANIGTGSATGYPVSEYSILGSKSSIVVSCYIRKILLNTQKSQWNTCKPRHNFIFHCERLFIFCIHSSTAYLFLYFTFQSLTYLILCRLFHKYFVSMCVNFSFDINYIIWKFRIICCRRAV